MPAGAVRMVLMSVILSGGSFCGAACGGPAGVGPASSPDKPATPPPTVSRFSQARLCMRRLHGDCMSCRSWFHASGYSMGRLFLTDVGDRIAYSKDAPQAECR